MRNDVGQSTKSIGKQAPQNGECGPQAINLSLFVDSSWECPRARAGVKNGLGLAAPSWFFLQIRQRRLTEHHELRNPETNAIAANIAEIGNALNIPNTAAPSTQHTARWMIDDR